MSKLATVLGSNGGMVAGAAVIAVAAVAAGIYINSRTAPAPEGIEAASEAAESPQTTRLQTETPEDVAEKPDDATEKPEDVAGKADDAAEKPEDVADAAPEPPSIDEVRVENDGLTIIAGRAAPGSEVTVLLDGQKNTTVAVDEGGGFAAITTVMPREKAQVLTLQQRVGKEELASVDEVILAPRRDPDIATAPSVEPEPAAVPEAVAKVEDSPAAPEDANEISERVAAADASSATPPADAPAPDPTITQRPPATEDATQLPSAETAPPAESQQVDVAAVDAPSPARADPSPASEVTVLRSTEDGVEVLSGTRPEALDNIEIDTISYSATGEVQLTGRAQADADVARVYVNNRPIVDLTVDADGRWRGALPDIDTGVYTLRIDEVAADGTVTSRVETPFQREDPELLAEASTQGSPARQITVQTGNTLWAIARDRYGDPLLYVQVFEANKDSIRDPDLIFPGQIFDLP